MVHGSIHHEREHLATPHGFEDDDRAQFLRRRPPDQALRWLERQLGAKVVAVRASRGGRSSAIHFVRLAGPTSRFTVVLRRYVLDELNEEEPDIAEREAQVLRVLERCEIETPRFVAADLTGASAGAPAIVMSRVPGRLDWSPRDIDPWLRRLAEVLPAIHATPADDGEVQPFRPYAPESWDAPRWMRDPTLWDRAVELFHGPALDPERVFVHRDYHPGNVLWTRRRVSAVVDWQSASIGPRAVDVWHCRGNLFGRFGVEVADRFITIWESVTGETYNPWAETVMLVDGLDWMSRHEVDQRDRDELEALLARRLAEFGR